MPGIKEGTVKFFKKDDPNNMFGFIIGDDGTEVFFHFNVHKNFRDPTRLPVMGDRVEYLVTRKAKVGKKPEADEWGFEPYVSYGGLCHKQLDETSQTGAYYIGGCDPYPDLSHGIRFKGTAAMYHSLRIHQDDVEAFVGRVKKWKAAKLVNRKAILIYYHPTEKTFFFSTEWTQPGLPFGFKSKTFGLPEAILPSRTNPDGIITNRVELVRDVLFFGDLREIPNPSPEFQDPLSPLILNTAA